MRRLAVVLVALGVVASALIFWLQISMREVRVEARSRFFEQYNRQQLLLAQQAARTLEELFDTFHHDLSLIARLFEDAPVDSRQMEVARPILQKIHDSLAGTPMIDMAVFDAGGTVITSYPPSPDTVGTNLAWRDYFAWAKNRGKPYQMHLTSFMPMTAGTARGSKALIVLEGIYDRNGGFKGLVLFTINFDELAKKYILPVKIGKNGYAWLTDVANRSVLVDPKNRTTGLSLDAAFQDKWPSLHNFLVTADDRKAGTGWYDYEDPEDHSKSVRKLVGYSPVNIGDHRWLLGVATPEPEIEALLGSFLHRQEIFSSSVAVSIFVGALVACGLLIAWNTMLSRRVAARTYDLARARAELLAAEKLAAIGHLALGLTHEIRNPLSAIRMNVQMIRQELPANALLQENFVIIEEEILRLNRLLGDVMGFARPRPLSLTRSDLTSIVDRVLSLLGRQLTESGVTISAKLERPLEIVCDPEQLQQVLLNLILNAVEAMEEAGAEKVLSIEVKRAEEMVILKVSDTGVGIPENIRTMIFNPFFTTKAQGGGLGLATLQSIVLRHGGGVEAESDGKSGSTFTVRLPVDGPPPAVESK